MKILKYQTTKNKLTRRLLHKHGYDVEVLCTVGHRPDLRSGKREREKRRKKNKNKKIFLLIYSWIEI